VRRVDDSVLLGENREALRRAVIQLHRAEKHKIDVASAIVEDYPQFGPELPRVANYP
jgi:hypothetical protein